MWDPNTPCRRLVDAGFKLFCSLVSAFFRGLPSEKETRKATCNSDTYEIFKIETKLLQTAFYSLLLQSSFVGTLAPLAFFSRFPKHVFHAKRLLRLQKKMQVTQFLITLPHIPWADKKWVSKLQRLVLTSVN